MRGRLAAVTVALLALACAIASSAASTPNRAAHRSPPQQSVAGTLADDELRALVAQMTLPEKIGMVNATAR